MTSPLPMFGPAEVLGEDPAPLDVIRVLGAKLRNDRPGLDMLDAYFRGRQVIDYIAPEVRDALGDRMTTVIVNLPRLVISTLEERLDVTGFRLPGADGADADIWRIWQANNFDRASSRLHTRMLRHGRAFTSVWANPDDRRTPRIAVESAREMAVEVDPATHDVRSALKMWSDGASSFATVYLPDRVLRFAKASGSRLQAEPEWVLRSDAAGGGTVDNPLGVVPVVPYFNQWDDDTPDGESELTDVIRLTDAVSKLATDMMVTSEFHASPRRWATGLMVPQGANAERVDEQARARWDAIATGKTWLAGKDVAFGQFDAADLRNFTTGVRQLLSLVATLYCLPSHYVGDASDNPASADAIRSTESRLNKRSKRRALDAGEGHEQTVRLVLMCRDGRTADPVPQLQTLWADPGTPTVAETADASIKLLGAGIIDEEQAQEDNGYTPQQREAMAARKAAAIAGQADPEMADRVQQAVDLMEEQGLSAQVAFAAVGLLTLAKGAKPGPGAPAAPAGDPLDEPAAAA